MQASVPISAARRRYVAGLAMFVAATRCAGATVEVTVLDKDGAPVDGVAVYAVPLHAELDAAHSAPRTQSSSVHASDPAHTAAGGGVAIMEQIDTAFVPHLLIVQTGAAVHFPNNDNVSHHVYSFSAAKTFELPLYKGEAHAPVRFDAPGLVVLGCNIHDGMLGYILVVETPYFAITKPDGVARLGTPSGEYAVHVWTPRARPSALPSSQHVTVPDDSAEHAVGFRFEAKLSPSHAHGSSSLTWEHY